MSLWARYQEDDEPEPEAGADRARVLWAGHEDEPEREPEPVRPARPEPDETPQDDDAAQPVGRRVVVPGAVAGILLAVLLIAVSGRGDVAVADVPSAWEDVPMRCDTTRFEEQGRAMEFFRCRALGDGPLPPGDYVSPQSQWTSDITRRDARENVMRITRDGELIGWAIY